AAAAPRGRPPRRWTGTPSRPLAGRRRGSPRAARPRAAGEDGGVGPLGAPREKRARSLAGLFELRRGVGRAADGRRFLREPGTPRRNAGVRTRIEHASENCRHLFPIPLPNRFLESNPESGSGSARSFVVQAGLWGIACKATV